jgi:sigma-B regulation protein RsbU (phosphoserine phosphatase)
MSDGAPAPEPERVKRALLSHLRHELRTPVNAIVGYCELMIEEQHPEPALRAELEEIRATGRKLQDRIGMLLDATGPEVMDAALVAAILSRLRRGLRVPTCEVIDRAERLLAQGPPPGVGEDLAKVLAAGRRLEGQLRDAAGLLRAAAAHVDGALPGAGCAPIVEQALASAEAVEAGAPAAAAGPNDDPLRDG